MKAKIQIGIVSLLALLVMSLTVVAQTAQPAAPDKPAVAPTTPAAPAPAKPAETPAVKTVQAPPAVAAENPFTSAWADDVKKPVDWFQWGFDQRIREKYLDKATTLSKNQGNDPAPTHMHYGRYRSRLWSTVNFAENLMFNSRLTWEWRYWDSPWAADTAMGPGRDASVNFDEALFDIMNVKYNDAFGMPLDITVGRQEIILGNGWLVLDGTPMDGSRTIFFDAARFTYRMEESKTDVDFIYIDQRPEADMTIMPFNDQDRANGLIEQEERGAILNISTKSLIPDATADVFTIWKRDMPVDQVANGNDGDIFTLGGRIDGAFDANWKYRTEAAVQTGDKNYDSICAFGTNNRLGYYFNDPMNNRLFTGYEYLSGDDNGTGDRNEAFDPLWGRWPQWSELYVYTYARETRIGETTNLHRLFVGHEIQLLKEVNTSKKEKDLAGLSLLNNYHLLYADENTVGAGPLVSDDGKFRGHLTTSELKYKIDRFWSGHLRGEFFFPGGYYEKDNRAMACFLRAELMFTF